MSECYGVYGDMIVGFFRTRAAAPANDDEGDVMQPEDHSVSNGEDRGLDSHWE